MIDLLLGLAVPAGVPLAFARAECFLSTCASPAGYLVSVDAYMNLQLASTEEYIDGQFTGNLGEVLIRCNNVLYMRGAPEEEDQPT